MLMSCNSNSYEIVGTYADSSMDGTTLYIRNYDNGDTIDSVTVANKCFHLEGKIDTPVIATMKSGNMRIMFVLEPGKIEINTENGSITGGAPLNAVMEELANKANEAQDEDTVLGLLKDSYEANKDNVVGLYALFNYLQIADATTDDVKAILDEASPVVKNSVRIKGYLEMFEKLAKTGEGSQYVDFSVKQPDGTEAKLSDYVGKDGILVVDFWASWCGPCRMVSPIVDEIAEERKDIKVCKVNVDEEPELASKFRVMSIPTLVVVKDGKVVNQSVGAKPKAQILALL